MTSSSSLSSSSSSSSSSLKGSTMSLKLLVTEPMLSKSSSSKKPTPSSSSLYSPSSSSSSPSSSSSSSSSNALKILILLLLVTGCHSQTWWSLGLLNAPHQNSPQPAHHHRGKLHDELMTFSCNTMNVLSYGQMKFCQLYEDHMIGVVKAAQMGIGECQHQFKDRRWNCTVMPKEPSVFGKVATRATRESAFLHAMMSAGVVHSISRMCRDGELTGCGCSKKKRPKKAIRPEWIWGGCGDNTDYGYKFSGGFVDVMEKEKNHPRKSPGLSRMLMNLHNNEVGRRAVYRHVKIGCKCHGTSGSCSVRTCWNQLPSFRQTGDRLRDRYDAAAQVTFNPQGTRLIPINRKFNRPTKDDLIFTEPSPNFCNPDPERGSLGTSGRVCDRRSQGTSGCGLMCCDRGYRSSKVKYVERCKCKFHWCCNVSCQTCEKSMHVHTCN